ncbi:MAG: hypothetical protein JSS30_08065 [Verrucomicrobia bacterium]|nr:hypothetical protein [Verrucomicrobiota bacterium]
MRKIILSLIIFVALERFCYWQTDGFRFAKVATTYPYPFSSPFESPPACLNQSFHYLGKGVQFYVFMGEDKQTILKLFKHHHAGFSSNVVQHLFPAMMEKRENRVLRLLKSAEIAKNELPEETGVFYTHLTKSDQNLGKIKIYDKLGIVHQIDLDKTEFLLQKRAVPLENKLHALLQTNQTEKAVQAMLSTLKMLDERGIKGIKNKDARILRNCGFIGDEAVEIDVGSFVYSNKYKASKRAKAKAKIKLLQFVKKHYPEQFDKCDWGLNENST